MKYPKIFFRMVAVLALGMTLATGFFHDDYMLGALVAAFALLILIPAWPYLEMVAWKNLFYLLGIVAIFSFLGAHLGYLTHNSWWGIGVGAVLGLLFGVLIWYISTRIADSFNRPREIMP